MLQLSKYESNNLKGIALLMLLCHHLFYIKKGLYEDIVIFRDAGLVWLIAMACKTCVALFVFLSGYGLTATVENMKTINWKKFFQKRFIHLFANYWLIWFLFVPIGIFIFGRTFSEVYVDHIIEKFILDFLGLLNCIGQIGYNPTWWFYSCIILLYLFFPLIHWANKNNILCYTIIGFCFLLVLIPCGPLNPIKYYLFPFVLGCYFRNGLIAKLLPPPYFKIFK